MKRLNGGYTNYFNAKYKRSGALLQGKFKAIEVNSYGHFLKLAVYINCNSEVHRICPAENWPWSSFFDYIGKRKGTLGNKNLILNEFKGKVEFKSFCQQVLPDIIKSKEIEKFALE